VLITRHFGNTQTVIAILGRQINNKQPQLKRKNMEKKHQVHNLIILDESGSMESIKTTIIQGFNELVQTIQGIEKQFPEQEHFISFVSFNGLG